MDYTKIEDDFKSLLQKINSENEASYRDIYEHNRRAFNDYKFWRHNPLPVFDDLNTEIRITDAKGGFIYIDKITGKMSKPYNLKPTTGATKPFFRDLSKPLLVKNELNVFHYKYLCDNVRKSEDFGGDNHIYMYYDCIEILTLLLRVEDITKYLEDEKLIFIFGKEDLSANYPLNFKKLYGINYEAMPPRPIRIDEIKRMVSDWYIMGYSGNEFLTGVLDWHKNLLTIREFAFSRFPYIYRNCLKDCSVSECVAKINQQMYKNKVLLNDLLWMFPFQRGGNQLNDANKLFACLNEIFGSEYRPTQLEWFKGFYLAYAMAAGRDLNQRISPMIVYETHHLLVAMKMEDIFEIYSEIPYFYALSIIRRPTVAIAAFIEHNYHSNSERNYIDIITDHILKTPVGYTNNDDKFLSYRVAVRFEDLKLEPKATLESVLDFLDIEWDDMLMRVTENGQTYAQFLPTDEGYKPTAGYDTAPVYNLHEKFFSEFDSYRIEMLFDEELELFGYKPLYYKNKIDYSIEEVKKLYEVRFKCEEFYRYEKQYETNQVAREKMIDYAIKRITNRDKNAATGKKLTPIHWLKPKEEFMTGKLYE